MTVCNVAFDVTTVVTVASCKNHNFLVRNSENFIRAPHSLPRQQGAFEEKSGLSQNAIIEPGETFQRLSQSQMCFDK